jgi:hypothetical protein
MYYLSLAELLFYSSFRRILTFTSPRRLFPKAVKEKMLFFNWYLAFRKTSPIEIQAVEVYFC